MGAKESGKEDKKAEERKNAKPPEEKKTLEEKKEGKKTGPRPPGELIGVVSGKGGVGKTTVSINLAAALAHEFGKKVVVIDCNIGTSHLGVALGMHYAPHTLNDVLRGKAKLTEALYKHEPSGMTVLPASMKATNIQAVDVSQIKKIAKQLALSYDYVVLDAGPGLGREAFATLFAAEKLLYVSIPTMPSVIDIVRYRQALQGEDKVHLGIVLNMFDGKEHQMSVDEVEKLSQLKVISKVPTDVEVHRSLAAEIPVVISKPKSPAGKELIDLAAKVCGEFEETPKKLKFHEKLWRGLKGADERFDEMMGFDR
jgi:septum site-determining protein MinD